MTKGEEACQHLSVSLKDHFESRIQSVIETINVLDKTVSERLHAMNQLREQVTTDRSQFATRELHDKLQSDLSLLTVTVTSLQTRLITFIGAMGLFNAVIVGLLIYHNWGNK